MSMMRSVWKILIGVKDALALLALLVFFGALYAAISFSPATGDMRGGALYLALDGQLVDQLDEQDPLAMLSGQAAPLAQVRTRDVVDALRSAAADDDIQVAVLDLNYFIGGGQVSIGDVTDALAAFRKSGKKVLAHAAGYADDGYALAAHADEIWTDPMGGVLIAGPGGTQPYFKGLLDRLGVTVNVYRAGKFKSFVEPYLRNDQSPEAREANQALATALWEDWKANVAKARPKAKVADLAADPAGSLTRYAGDLAKTGVAMGLVDKLGDETAFGRRVAELVGSDETLGPGDFNRSDLAAYLAANPPEQGSETVAVVHISGEIVDGYAPAGTAGGDTIAELINQALTQEDAKALVLRIDSPGGAVMASEKIRLAALEARKAKIPVIVSMGNVAASGGYWAAMAGDHIFAEPATITGSIGVFGVIPSFEKGLARYGVTSDGVGTTPLSGQPDLIGGINEAGNAVIQTAIEDIYRRFTGLVATARKFTPDKVEMIAQGRVWAGGDARQLGLFDAFGSLDDAIAEAAKRAGIAKDDIRTVHVEPVPDLFSEWLGAPIARLMADRVHADLPSRLRAVQQARFSAALHTAMAVANGPAVQVRCLACPGTQPAVPSPSPWFNRIFN